MKSITRIAFVNGAHSKNKPKPLILVIRASARDQCYFSCIYLPRERCRTYATFNVLINMYVCVYLTAMSCVCFSFPVSSKSLCYTRARRPTTSTRSYRAAAVTSIIRGRNRPTAAWAWETITHCHTLPKTFCRPTWTTTWIVLQVKNISKIRTRPRVSQQVNRHLNLISNEIWKIKLN